MAGASLLTLIDDISVILDDVSVMTKVAAKKTVGVLGDDLALNANQVAGVKADREIPVVLGVAKGSAINKVILAPLALIISEISPTLVTILLMLGGLYLCFEGAEKILHKFLHSKGEIDEEHQAHLNANADENIDLVAFEKEKIKGAVRTDFILSAEIIVISLGTLAETATLLDKALVLTMISVIMTVGVYGLVAGIVKLDDLGLHLLNKSDDFSQKMGKAILAFAPMLMKFLSIAGTLAMFLVGGGIIAHGIGFIHHGIEHLGQISGIFSSLTTNILNGLVGLVTGLIVVGIVTAVNKMRGKAH